MRLIILFLLFISYNLSSQVVWEPLDSLNLENVEIIHVNDDRILGTLDFPPKLLVSENLGTTWTEISDLPQLESTPLVDVDRDGNYLVLFDEAVYKLNPDGYIWIPFFELPEAPVVWNDIAAFSNGNILIRERKGLRLHDANGDFIKDLDFGNTVTKNFIKGEGDEHYFFLSPGNVYGYIVKINSDMEILEEYPEDEFYIHSHFAYDGSRFYSTTGYSDDGRTWTAYPDDLKGIITVLKNGDIHMIDGCTGFTYPTNLDCTGIYVSTDQGETFEYQTAIELDLRLPNPGAADLRRTTLMGPQAVGDNGILLFHEKKNYYSENGQDVWMEIGEDEGLPSLRRVEAATKENVVAGILYKDDHYMISDNQGWLDLSASACGISPKIISLPNGTLLGSHNCISENQGMDWMAPEDEITTWNRYVKDNVTYTYNRDAILTSVDFGKNWSDDPMPQEFENTEFHIYDFSSEGFMYPFDYILDEVYKYTISGDLISLINFDNERIWYLRTAYIGPHVYVITENSFYVSEDNAENFAEKNLPPIINTEINGFYVDHENSLYIFTEKEIWISYDHGTVWQNISPVFPFLHEIIDMDVSWDGYIFAATIGTPILRTNKSEIVQIFDLDGDGFTSVDDCDDNDANVNPDQLEEPYNGIDDDCDPETRDDDLDEDGFLLAEDCDDNNSDINPNAEEIANNEIDEDCDGFDLVTSTYELSNSSINIYPNPATDFIKIDVSGTLDYQVNLYDLEGKLIHTANNSHQIITELFSIGTYLLEIKDLRSNYKIVERVVIVN